MTANPKTLLLAANHPWNVVNYRAGLIRALQQAGWNIVVASPDGPEADAIRQLGVEFHPLPMSRRGTSPAADLGVLKNLVGLMKDVRPAAMLGFTSKPNIYGSIAARICKVPVINNISGLGTVFTRETLLTKLVAGLYRVALKHSRTVFFQNRDDLELFVKRRLVSREQTRLLPGSGVDLAYFSPLESSDSRGPRTFLLVARLLWDKGIREFVEAAGLIRRKHPGTRFQILGIVEPESSAAVPLSAVREWESEGTIEYLGTARDVRPAIAAADCVVLPSYYREGVPRVLLEASAMAVPVITADSPGCRDAVEDGVTGYLCEPRSVESLLGAMERIIALPAAERKDMGLAARAKMDREFREEIVHRAYIDALGHIAETAS